MAKYRLWADYGYPSTRKEAVFEFDTELTEEELEEEAREFFWDRASIGYGYEKVED